jgi:secondary thiamine-phosphate synthase enzyme
MWHHYDLTLRARARGFHLVTEEIVAGLADLPRYRVGLCHLLLQHTSASLCLNENADPDVRRDLAAWSDRAAPDGAAWMAHDAEGPDDMPAHIKAALFGTALTLPIADGRLALGTWQGIWLGEHRDQGGARRVVATLTGE